MQQDRSSATPARGPVGVADVRGEEACASTGPWRTVVWNDPVNLMSYVSLVFRRYFGYSRAVAEKLMMQVHQEGRAVVSRGAREQVERDVQAMHSYGLQATIERTDEN